MLDTEDGPAEPGVPQVDSLEAPRWMPWHTPTGTWAWRPVRLPDRHTRLITRSWLGR